MEENIFISKPYFTRSSLNSQFDLPSYGNLIYEDSEPVKIINIDTNKTYQVQKAIRIIGYIAGQYFKKIYEYDEAVGRFEFKDGKVLINNSKFHYEEGFLLVIIN